MISLVKSYVRPGQALRRARRVPAVGVVALIAVIAVAGCSGSGSSKKPSAAKPMSASKAITLAADATQKIRSLTANFDVSVVTGHVTATMQMQLKPTYLIDMNLSVTPPGQAATNLEEILTPKALFLKDPQLSQRLGKPWLEISMATLSSRSGVNFTQLLQNLENTNPENQVKFFTASKDVHVVGQQTIGGVATTEYAGSYTPAAAIKQLPAGLHKLLAPVLKLLGSNPVQFHVWIDGHHLTRKAVINETIAGQSAVTTYTITSVNQPVHVTYPSPGEVRQYP
ncbi:MAG TPA: hypothetical protein VF834_04300 [Streptosporangiaceae bacterium]